MKPNNNMKSNKKIKIEVTKEMVVGLGPNSNLIKIYKAKLKALSTIEKETLIGLLLGDASIRTRNFKRSFSIQFEWSDRSKAYLMHVHNLLNRWVLSQPHEKIRVNQNGNKVVTWGFQTFTHHAFSELGELFIPAGIKSIPEGLITKYLTARSLAYWFMDDGGKLDYNKGSKNMSVVLNTQSFTESEVEIMMKELSYKLNLKCEMRYNKGKKIIIIKHESYNTFINLVDKYIVPEMRYKLPNNK